MFHLMVKSGNFKYLKSLDLSDNEIHNPGTFAEHLSGLPSLRSLQLEGNPGSVSKNIRYSLRYLYLIDYIKTNLINKKSGCRIL